MFPRTGEKNFQLWTTIANTMLRGQALTRAIVQKKVDTNSNAETLVVTVPTLAVKTLRGVQECKTAKNMRNVIGPLCG